MARPGIEPRASYLRVRCPTGCATRPGKCIGKLYSEDKVGSGSKKGAQEILITAVNFHFQLCGVPTNELELLLSC